MERPPCLRLPLSRVMDWESFCIGKADECDGRADAITDVELRASWCEMAHDWRVAATRPEPKGGRGDQPS